MLRALSTAATGMQAQSMRLEQIATDMANMNTTAYKRGRTEFHDLMYQTIKEPGGQPGQLQTPVGIQVGNGVQVAAQYSVHEQGSAKQTGALFDLMINGEGFFPIQLPNGQIAYTRDGSFKMDSEGKLTTSGGYALIPTVQIPAGTAGITITSTGEVRAIGNEQQEQTIAQLEIVKFLNPAAMMKMGENLWQPTVAAGALTQGIPGENGLGNIRQGAVELSNVNPTEALVEMITTQRAFETNSKVISTGDQMWSTTNNIVNR